jgi:hypothetical protein
MCSCLVVRRSQGRVTAVRARRQGCRRGRSCAIVLLSLAYWALLALDQQSLRGAIARTSARERKFISSRRTAFGPAGRFANVACVDSGTPEKEEEACAAKGIKQAVLVRILWPFESVSAY